MIIIIHIEPTLLEEGEIVYNTIQQMYIEMKNNLHYTVQCLLSQFTWSCMVLLSFDLVADIGA